MIQIPFHPRFSEAVAEGSKRFTIRLDPGYNPEPGESMELVDGDRERLAVEQCCLNATVPAGFIPSWKFDGHRQYATFDELQEELAEYYPAAEITPNTPITVIGW